MTYSVFDIPYRVCFPYRDSLFDYAKATYGCCG